MEICFVASFAVSSRCWKKLQRCVWSCYSYVQNVQKWRFFLLCDIHSVHSW